ncbi:MAG: hypothetical protein ACTHJT_16920 [Cytophaga sp.]|uniref:hypothetical protein n=1 Tax=Cytophaga sp. TaxID=29535 RepID=UPI003F7F2931
MLLKKSISIYISMFLIGVFALQISVNTLVYIQFKIKQQIISEEICVQRFNKANTCKGRCYLKSRLKKCDPEKSCLHEYLKFKIDLYCVHDAEKVSVAFIFLSIIYPAYNSHMVDDVAVDFFHPPA